MTMTAVLAPLAVSSAPRAAGIHTYPPRGENASRSRPSELQMLAHLGHELKNPLGAVLGFAHLIAADPAEPLSDTQRHRLELIEQAGQHMLSIITGMMQAAAKACSAEPAAHRSDDTADLATLVCEATQWMQPTAERYGVHIAAEPVHGRVRGSTMCVRQVLLNLLSNAAKYNRAEGWVHVRQLKSDASGCVGIEVSDTGRGMSRAMLARLFTPFDRLGQERGDVEGTGVGLCIVRDLVQGVGGRIEVDSTPGQGSRFSVWFQAA